MTRAARPSQPLQMLQDLSLFLLNDDIFPVFDNRTPSRNLVRTDYIVEEMPKHFVVELVFNSPNSSLHRDCL